MHAVRPAVRRTLGGGVRADLVIEVTQRRRGYFDEAKQQEMDDRARAGRTLDPPDFIFRAGTTILIDPRTGEVRRIIRTPGSVNSDDELTRVRRFRTGQAGVVGNAFDAGLLVSRALLDRAARDEPFALLHQIEE